jgi:hypothetical protein
VAEKSLDYPKQERKAAKKAPQKKPYTMEIHESLERIAESELSDLGLLDLSIRALMPCEIYRELKKRLERIESLLENGAPGTALVFLMDLLASPQKRHEQGGQNDGH